MLLVSDRPLEAAQLKRTVEAVEPCLVVSLEHSLFYPAVHSIILCDLALDSDRSIELARSTLRTWRTISPIPVLHLARQEGGGALAVAQAIDATVVLPSRVSHAQILFTVRRLVEVAHSGSRQRSSPQDRAVRVNIGVAGQALADLFDASRHGEPIARDRLDAGSDAVIAAVAERRIGSWLDVVKGHDDVTYRHCLLVAGFAVAFSTRLGVTSPKRRMIAKAALLHDIGKSAVPLEILNSKGRLSDAEMAIMKLHPVTGYDMLVRQGGFDQRILHMVRHHHEYLDGSGYPDALHGPKISMFVRIITICDIYAALIERRPYKAAWSSLNALGIMTGMGHKLDVGLVSLFRSAVGQAPGPVDARFEHAIKA